MRYLGLDFGEKRIGVAVSDLEGGFAFPREVLPNNDRTLDKLRELIHKEEAGAIVVGDTRAASGEKNPVSDAAETFIHALEAHMGVPVHRGFEAWSSIEASRFAPEGQEHNDAAAAAIMLQRFLDTNRKR